MPSGLAAVVCAAGILGLFLLDRDRTSRTSPALWVPAAWLGIATSRDISQWFNTVLVTDSPDQLLEGSPVDRIIYAGLLVAGLVVLVSRAERARSLLRANWPLVVFFLFCAISVLWSDYPFVAFKRWSKALGNLVMVLVVLTERDPPAAVRQLLTRTGFLLIPLSVLLIKYFPHLGRQFSPWGGMAYSSGVAIGKNGLGILCLVLGLGSLWRFLAALSRDERPRMARPLIAHGAVLAMALWLFWAADSATSLGCFLIAALLLGLTSRYGFARRPMVVSLLVAGIVSVCVLGLLVDTDMGVAQAMGRDSTLTTRTQLWRDLLRISVDPWVGTGFESFWLGERAKALWRTHWWHPNQAHNGYLEVFLNLGWIGVILLGFVIAWGFRNVVGAVRRDRELGGLRLAFFVAAILYNLTEAAFKVMHPVWIAFLLAVTVVPSADAGGQAPAAERPTRTASAAATPSGRSGSRPERRNNHRALTPRH